MKLLYIISFVLITACAINPVTEKPSFVFLDEQEEIELGQQMYQQFLERYPVYDDSELQEYVNRVGQNIASQSHRSQLDFHFTILDQPEMNAFALPGGYIFITRGMLAYLESEAELAAVLGHEVGHVAALHAARMDALNRVEHVLEKIFNRFGDRVQKRFHNFEQRLASKYSQENELEADRLAVEYLARLGYAPTAMHDLMGMVLEREKLFKTLASDNHHTAGLYHGFSSHPDSRYRQKVVDEDINRLNTQILKPRDPETNHYLKQIDGLVFGDNADLHGRLIGQQYLHPASRIGLIIPRGWHLQRNSNTLKMYPADKNALIEITRYPSSSQLCAEQVLDKLHLEQPLTDMESIQARGLKGVIANTSAMIDNQQISLRVAAWVSNDFAWSILSSAHHSKEYQQVIEKTIRSFHILTVAEMAGVEDWKLEIVQVVPGTTYEQLAEQSPLLREPEAQLRLLNRQTEIGQQPIPGSWIKVIR